MGNKLETRLFTTEQIINGTHPLIKVAFWPSPNQKDDDNTSITHRKPQIPVPNLNTSRILKGDMESDKTYNLHSSTGKGIDVRNGFNATIDSEVGHFLVLVDTETDPFLAGIITKAQDIFAKNPLWNTSRKLFELSMLCFGDWGQSRYLLDTLKQDSSGPQKIFLGELIWTTNIEDLDCTILSLAMQAVGKPFDLGISLHSGKIARFSPYCHGEGLHSWNIFPSKDGPKALDWTNYSPQVKSIFALSQKICRNELYDQFCKTYNGFPLFYNEPHPPTPEQYYELFDNPILATRNSAVYWNDLGEYLGTCSIPDGWDNFS